MERILIAALAVWLIVVTRRLNALTSRTDSYAIAVRELIATRWGESKATLTDSETRLSALERKVTEMENGMTNGSHPPDWEELKGNGVDKSVR